MKLVTFSLHGSITGMWNGSCTTLSHQLHSPHSISCNLSLMAYVYIFPCVLLTERRIDPSFAQCLPEATEAQYQDEFYRCCYIHSNGSLVTFPEFTTSEGRVDFYIPTKQWGAELLRDGDRLAQHSGRFSLQTGSYGTTLSLSDYIILDCCTTFPRVTHLCKFIYLFASVTILNFTIDSDLPKPYNIVFSDNFHNVRIIDNRLCVPVENSC
jgi:hypothetical protein